MPNEIIAADRAGQVEVGSLSTQLLITYGKRILSILVGIAIGRNWLTSGQATEIITVAVPLLLLVGHDLYNRLNQRAKEQARAILPTDATIQQVQQLTQELNPLAPNPIATTVITKEGEVDREIINK